MMKYLTLAACLLLWGCSPVQAPQIAAPSVEETIVEVPEPEPDPAPPSKPEPRFAIATMLGLGSDTVKNILGKPSLLRLEKQAEVWLYRNAQCVMHLYFYDNENGDLRLDYLETSALDLEAKNPTVSPVACLNSHVPVNEDAVVTADPQPFYPEKHINPQPDR